MENKYIELKENYRSIINLLINNTQDIKEEDTQKFIISLTLSMWSANNLYADEYSKALYAITGVDYNVEQIYTAMCCCKDKINDLIVPQYIKEIKSKGKYKDLLNLIGEYLGCVALINGDFTMEEANTWTNIMKKIQGDYFALNLSSFNPKKHITELNEEGYYRILETNEETSTNSENINNEEPLDEMTNEVNKSIEDVRKTIKEIENLNLGIGEMNQQKNNSKTNTNESFVRKENLENEQTLDELLLELEELVGLDTIKKDVVSLLNFIKIANLRKSRGLKVPEISYHLVFTGNPGTGKTTIARLIAKLYYKMGLLSKGQLVETDRSSLVAGYLGQTAIKTQKVIQEALGGVLFIDEAYSLAREEKDQYGQEAIETLLKAMEDNRDELVVIVAGYDELMHQFIDSNPGLRSRFNKYFQFPDYTGEELEMIFESFCHKNGYAIEDNCKSYLTEKFIDMYEDRKEHFGNARTVRNVFENAIQNQADRLASYSTITKSDLIQLTLDDICPAIEEEQ